MAHFDTRERTFIANTGGVSANRLVIYVAGNKVGHASAGEYPIGVTKHAAIAGGPVAVKLLSADGTYQIAAHGSITEADLCQVTGTAGKITGGSSANGPLFRALNASGGADQLVECVFVGSMKSA